ncbi:MAG: hypothetical protein H0U76_05355 [Ktedonobacteraceae bacterium]|nr:hypothetical protein [Ktedonobacteraceae bacterium]
MCVANVQYKKPSDDGTKQSKSLLRYLTYRESRDEAARYAAGRERWVDHGMGTSVAEIAQHCDDLKSEHVLAFSLVFNPNPDLIGMVAPEEREHFVIELTESVIEDFFDKRGLDTGVEMSYVLHHRLTDDPQAPGLHDPHTHVVLPGTVYDEEHGERVPLFFSRNRKENHVELLHGVTQDNIADLMDRYGGRDWERRYDELAAVREQERQIVADEPHGEMVDEKGEVWNMWCGTRRTDDHTTSLGFYRFYPTPSQDDADALRLEFRPLLSGLSHEQAVFFAEDLAQEIDGDMDKLKALTEMLSEMSEVQRAALIKEIGRFPSFDTSPNLEL